MQTAGPALQIQSHTSRLATANNFRHLRHRVVASRLHRGQLHSCLCGVFQKSVRSRQTETLCQAQRHFSSPRAIPTKWTYPAINRVRPPLIHNHVAGQHRIPRIRPGSRQSTISLTALHHASHPRICPCLGPNRAKHQIAAPRPWHRCFQAAVISP